MVSKLSIILMGVSLILAVVVPIIFAILFHKRTKYHVSAIFVGALTFIVFQVLTRIPMLNSLQYQQWFMAIAGNILLYSVFLGLTAGLFEELGRFVTMKLFLNKKLTWQNAVAFGIGHGGIEALLLAGMPIITNMLMSSLINSGVFDSTIAPTMSAIDAANIKAALIATPSLMFLAGGVERILAICCHVGFSVMVMYGIASKRFGYVLLAVLLHTLLNVPAVLLMDMGLNIWLIELMIAVFAVLSLIYTVKAKAQFERLQESALVTDVLASEPQPDESI